MVSEAPQWLFGAVDDALAGIGATAPGREGEVRRILQAWEIPVGHLEGPRYLALMFEKLDQLDGPASDSDVLRVVMAYRVAQVPGGWVNRRSAKSGLGIQGATPGSSKPEREPGSEETAGRLEALGVPPATARRVSDLLRQLRNHQPAKGDFDGQILADADLSVLSTSPQRYKQLTQALYELGMESDPEGFLRERHGYLEQVLSRGNIYHTPQAAQWDPAARQNLEAELANLERRLQIVSSEDSGPARVQPASRSKPTVMRASVAKKQVQAAREDVTPPAAAKQSAIRSSQLSSDTTEDEPFEEHEDFSTTSTLESVADLIEGHRRSKRSDSKRSED